MAGAVLTMGTVLGVLTPVAGSTAAWADGPQHVKSTETLEYSGLAGEFCDFTLDNAGTLSDNAIIFRTRRSITSRFKSRTRIGTPVSR